MSRNKHNGFTLIELLVVIAILGLLLGVVAVNSGSFFRAGGKAKSTTTMHQLELMVEDFEIQTGMYPASSISDPSINLKSTSDLNDGIEALVAALLHKDYAGKRPDEAMLINSDEDSADKDFSVFPNRELFEIGDNDGSPFVYIESSHYSRTYSVNVMDRSTDTYDVVDIQAYKSKKTGAFANFDSYQIWSPGTDGEFGTHDDIANFEIEIED